MRKLQGNSCCEGQAAGSHTARSGHKKGLRGLGQILRKIVHKCLGVSSAVSSLSRQKDKKRKRSKKGK